jgi:hypothetical protein
MRDSTLNPQWLAEQMRVNPPRNKGDGFLFSGPVRLTFPNLFKPRVGKDAPEGDEGKFGASLLFPLGTNFQVFHDAWLAAAKEAFPRNFVNGQATGLHVPFHDQAEKTVGVKPLMGYTPGAVFFNTSSKFKPAVVDMNMNPIVDESRVYPGVWAFVTLNVYKYSNRKTGIGFGMQNVMIIADDTRLGGGGSDPAKDFAGITITAQSNVADKFMTAPVAGAAAGIMPSGGFVGSPGQLPVQPLPVTAEDLY